MNNKFFTFIKSYLSFIDNGHFYIKPFSWLYAILAIINLILPLFVFYIGVNTDDFNDEGKGIIAFLLGWIIITFASWVSFQLWWNRRSKIIDMLAEGNEFIATLSLSHLIQTIGEWLGTWIGIVGFGINLITIIILGEDYYYIDAPWIYELGLNNLQTGSYAIVITPIYGFLIIVVTRFFAEQFKAIASIANNTSEKQNKKNRPSF